MSASIAHLCGAIVVAQQRRLVLMQEDVEHVAYASTGWRREWRRVERTGLDWSGGEWRRVECR